VEKRRLKNIIAIHAILYVRQIYPADLFLRHKTYDTPVKEVYEGVKRIDVWMVQWISFYFQWTPQPKDLTDTLTTPRIGKQQEEK
jgi:hypothetical protein